MTALETLWQQPVARALGSALIGFLWQGVAVALAVGAILACMGRRPSRERYAVACLGLLVMALLPVGSFWSALRGAASGASPAPAEGNVAVTGTPGAATWLEALHPWLLSAWLCGVLLFSLRTVLAWRRALALTREGTREPEGSVALALVRMMERTRVSRPVRLLESVAVEVPTVVGLWRPLILVPASSLAGLSVSQLEAILAHELAHIRRHDYLVNLLQALVETGLFYHPAVWWLSARIREEREHCADDVAVESCGDALMYSRALWTLEQLRAPAPVPALAANGGSLLLRIRRLVDAPKGGAPLHPWRLAGSLAAATLILVLGAARHAHATGAQMEAPRPFQNGMERPVLLSGEDPVFPKSMLPPAAPKGTFPSSVLMIVTCTITTEGILTDCVLSNPKPELAELELELLRVLSTRRYKPVTEQGKPIAVRYVFNTKFVWPEPEPSP
jgi:beta-lactamase regulating signal transducer with metallopeptidase domain